MKRACTAVFLMLCLILSACARFEATEIRVDTPQTTQAETLRMYVLNTSSMKFHLPDCSGVRTMKASNREDAQLSREELMERGYAPCGTCDP